MKNRIIKTLMVISMLVLGSTTHAQLTAEDSYKQAMAGYTLPVTMVMFSGPRTFKTVECISESPIINRRWLRDPNTLETMPIMIIYCEDRVQKNGSEEEEKLGQSPNWNISSSYKHIDTMRIREERWERMRKLPEYQEFLRTGVWPEGVQ